MFAGIETAIAMIPPRQKPTFSALGGVAFLNQGMYP